MAVETATVFGGSGFVGRYVISALAKAGARIRVAVRRPDEALFLKPMGDVGQITPVQANIRDDASVAAALGGCDLVVNLVGILCESGRQTFDAVHRDGARRIARAAREAGVGRLIHCSAIGADVTSPSAYAASKAAGEDAVRAAFPRATVIRPSVAFGPEDGFINRFAMLAQFAPALPLIGGGHTRFQPVYAGDVAEAARVIAERPGTAGRTYELAGPRVYTFKELMEYLLAEIGRRRLLLPVPFAAATLQAFFLELLPFPPLTRDQVTLLRFDNVATGAEPGLAELGITPTALESVAPGYLGRYCRGGKAA